MGAEAENKAEAEAEPALLWKNYIIKMALRAIFLFLSYGSVRGQNLAVLEGEKPKGILKGESDASGIEEE